MTEAVPEDHPVGRLICEDITVVEAGAGSLAAAIIGMILADNGAKVVKIEPPEGDRLRAAAPNGFLVWNRGKRSCIADLRTSQGQETARTLIDGADVFIDGFSEGVTDRWGLGYDVLRERNPPLVYCAIRGFGTVGPYASVKAYEGIVAAKSGIYSRGDFAYRPGPVFLNSPIASHGAAHMGMAGVLSALLVREKTGRGQHIEASMWQGLTAFDYFGTLMYQAAGKVASDAGPPERLPVVKATRQSFTVCTADDKWVSMTTMLPHQSRALLRVCGIEAVMDDPRFARAPVFDSAEEADEFEDRVWEAARSLSAQEISDRAAVETDVACEMCIWTEDAFAHPQVVHNGHALVLEDPERGAIRQVGPIARFDRTPSRITHSAPALGDLDPVVPAPSSSSASAPPEIAPPPLHPLEGVTILEFGYFVAMPQALVYAAALGARVIKIEDARPKQFGASIVRGDPTRYSFGVAESSSRMLQGKESIAVDLNNPEARKIILDLVASADAFVCGFRPGIADKFGLGAEDLQRANPRLVYLHAAGYGPDGPKAERAMYAATAVALTGALTRQCGVWLDPEISRGMNVMELRAVLAPRIPHLVEGDGYASLGVLSALMLAVFHQQRTGEGQFVSTTMINSNLYAMSDDFTGYDGKVTVPHADPEQYGLGALYRSYAARDGWVFLAAPTDRDWMALTKVMGRHDLAADPRFSRSSSRRDHDEELTAELATCFAERSAEEWEASLLPHGVACVAVNPQTASAWTATDPGLRESGLTLEVVNPVFGPVIQEGVPLNMSATPCRVAPPCMVGQHSETILKELGYSADAISALRREGVVFAPEPPE